MHISPKSTEEYQVLGDNITMLGEDDLPDVDHWDRNVRNLLIIDEINIQDKSKAHK